MNQLDAIEVLRSTRCICGGKKSERTAFCKGCYFSLSPETRRALYQRIGVGFEEAYTAAAEILTDGQAVYFD